MVFDNGVCRHRTHDSTFIQGYQKGDFKEPFFSTLLLHIAS
jgi:hypothetical protein